MKVYHITYIMPSDNIATGIRYEAESPIIALAEFEIDFPDAIFLYIASSDMFTHKYGYGN